MNTTSREEELLANALVHIVSVPLEGPWEDAATPAKLMKEIAASALRMAGYEPDQVGDEAAGN